MRPEDGSRAERLCQAALKKSPEERAAYLEGLSELAPELRDEVERLLTADGQDSLTPEELSPGEVTADTAPAPSRPTTAPETHVGPYRLIREIGRGGMGTVHLAVRDDDEYRKRVAVKLLRKGMDSDDVVRRFRSERQILAAVEHSSIAKLYDGGTTETGSPYFVMELVEGLPLDEYCDAHRLSIPERLQLFRKVCAAVQVAHQNLVVHRDLKPSNILVTADGEPKLLDFGIAKLLNPELSSTTVDPTRFQMGLMTPAYASPEQVRGEPITTATDVYSLGIILYELLTGHRPYRVKTTSLHELTRVVCEVEPTRPSQIVARQGEVPEPEGTSRKVTPETVSRARGDSADKLRRQLSGDLDNIVMMALRKESQRRYPSVEQLSEDIRRHLEGRPVRARQATVAYRLSKFVQRQRVSLAVGVLFIACVVGFTVVTTRARARAEREAAKAQVINDFMQKTLGAADPFLGEGRDVTVVEALGKAVEELEGSFSGEPEVRAAIQRTIGTTYQELGRYDLAEPLLTAALETQRRVLGEDHPEVADSFSALAALRLEQSDYTEAARLSREALRRHRALPGKKAEVAEDLDDLASSLHFLGDNDVAERLEREALRLHRELSDGPTEELSYSLQNLALIVEARGDLAEAERLYRESLDIDRALLGDENANVARTISNLGQLIVVTHGHEAAEPYLREALAIQRKVLGEHPDTATSLNVLGQVLSAKGEAAAAERLFREALAMQRKLLGDGHPGVAVSLSGLARELQKAGRLAEAEPLYREAIAIWQEEGGDAQPGLAMDLSALARLLEKRGGIQEAEALHRRACAILDEAHGTRDWRSGYCRSVYAAFLTGQERYEEAEGLLLAAYPALRDSLGPGHEQTKLARRRLAELYEAWGKPEKAAEYRAPLPPADASGR